MKRYLYLFAMLFVVIALTLPSGWTGGMRSTAVGIVAPLWSGARDVLQKLPLMGGVGAAAREEIRALQLENYQLRCWVDQLRAERDLQLKSPEAREGHPLSVMAKLIFREGSSWGSSCWINVGAEDHPFGKQVIAKNSPVVVGASIVGVVEQVESHRSRVRLITDGSLNPSVQVMGGGTRTLAKGWLQGARYSHFRSLQPLLKMVGCPFGGSDHPAEIQRGDRVVTTGMDGVFPEGLEVGAVESVYLAPPGELDYSVEVVSAVSNWDQLRFVTILPPLMQSD